METKITHGSLFSGIGGFDLAAEWMGWDNKFHCEWNEFGQKVLKYYWPNAITYGDITKTDFTIWRGKIDVLTGGFPCQPYSLAGKRKGKEDDRHLWPEMLRAIREIQPKWVVGENVFGIVNWDGGLVFNEVQTDLEAQGYEVQPYVLPACAVNAPHRRDRVWFIAKNTKCDGFLQRKPKQEGTENGELGDISTRDSNGVYKQENAGIVTNTNGLRYRGGCMQSFANKPKERKMDINPQGDWNRVRGEIERCSRASANTGNKRLQRSENIGSLRTIGEKRNKQFARSLPPTWGNFPTQPPIRERNDGISSRMAKYITKELQYEISNTSQENRIENLHEVRERILQKEIWEQVRRFYSLESKEVLLQTMQLYSREHIEQIELSPFSEDFSKIILRHLRKYGEFRYSPQGHELQKQQPEQLRNSLSFLPYEVALAARRFEAAITKFENWHRNESIKAYGNAIVPQIALQIFKAINKFTHNN